MRVKGHSKCCSLGLCSAGPCACSQSADAVKVSPAEFVQGPDSPSSYGGRALLLADGKTWARPAVYVTHPHGRTTFAVTNDNPICDESLPLTDDELSLVVLPMLTLLQSFHVDPCFDLSDDTLLRTVRGYINRWPHTQRFLDLVHQHLFSPHVGAAA